MIGFHRVGVLKTTPLQGVSDKMLKYILQVFRVKYALRKLGGLSPGDALGGPTTQKFYEYPFIDTDP